MRFTSTVTETVSIFLAAYLAFEVTEVIDYSGITATLACGLTYNAQPLEGVAGLHTAGGEGGSVDRRYAHLLPSGRVMVV